MRPGEIRSLTGLRGVAALVVMAFHYSLVGRIDGPNTSILRPAYLMVDLFFVLSGFVMALTYSKAFRDGSTWVVYRKFLEARIARIYPPYIFVTAVVFILVLVNGADYPSRPWVAFLTNATLIQSLGVGYISSELSDRFLAPGWSISVELGAYLLFPALALLALFCRRLYSVGVAVGCVALLATVAWLPRRWMHTDVPLGSLDFSNGRTLWPFIRCLAEFSLGLLAWRVAGTSRARRLIGHWCVDAILLTALATLWCVPGSDLPIVLLFPVIVLQICTDRSPLARLLATPLCIR